MSKNTSRLRLVAMGLFLLVVASQIDNISSMSVPSISSQPKESQEAVETELELDNSLLQDVDEDDSISELKKVGFDEDDEEDEDGEEDKLDDLVDFSNDNQPDESADQINEPLDSESDLNSAQNETQSNLKIPDDFYEYQGVELVKFRYELVNLVNQSTCQSICTNTTGCLGTQQKSINGTDLCLHILDSKLAPDYNDPLGTAILVSSAPECFKQCMLYEGQCSAIEYSILTKECQFFRANNFVTIENPDHLAISFSKIDLNDAMQPPRTTQSVLLDAAFNSSKEEIFEKNKQLSSDNAEDEKVKDEPITEEENTEEDD